MKHKTFIGASLLAAIAASLCCILPIVFALGGFAIVGASAFFESLRPYFTCHTESPNRFVSRVLHVRGLR